MSRGAEDVTGVGVGDVLDLGTPRRGCRRARTRQGRRWWSPSREDLGFLREDSGVEFDEMAGIERGGSGIEEKKILGLLGGIARECAIGSYLDRAGGLVGFLTAEIRKEIQHRKDTGRGVDDDRPLVGDGSAEIGGLGSRWRAHLTRSKVYR